jgi:N-acetylglutamate synthase-like GNAT family acetyltransferase
VLLAPLLVLDPAALVPDLPVDGATVRLLDPAGEAFAQELAASRAVAQLGFGAPAHTTPTTETAVEGGLITESAGPRERDAAIVALSPALVESSRERSVTGGYVTAIAESPDDGILATGGLMVSGDVAEIAGVATLPSARGRGYASQLTATLARTALQSGITTVFLSAGDDDVARLYTKVGFRRLGTACIAEPSSVSL